MLEKLKIGNIYLSADDTESAEPSSDKAKKLQESTSDKADEVVKDERSVKDVVAEFIDTIPEKYHSIIKYLLENSNKDKWVSPKEVTESVGKNKTVAALQLNELMTVLRQAGKGIKLYKKKEQNSVFYTLNRVSIKSLLRQQQTSTKKANAATKPAEDSEPPVKGPQVTKRSSRRILGKKPRKAPKSNVQFDFSPAKSAIDSLNDSEQRQFHTLSVKMIAKIREIRIANDGEFHQRNLMTLRSEIPRGINQKLNIIYAALRSLTYEIEAAHKTNDSVVDSDMILIFKFLNKTL